MCLLENVCIYYLGSTTSLAKRLKKKKKVCLKSVLKLEERKGLKSVSELSRSTLPFETSFEIYNASSITVIFSILSLISGLWLSCKWDSLIVTVNWGMVRRLLLVECNLTCAICILHATLWQLCGRRQAWIFLGSVLPLILSQSV